MTPVIPVTELAEALEGAAPPAVLDVRWSLTGPHGRELFEQSHLPGAVFIDLDTELADPVGDGSRGRHPLPDWDRFGAAMALAGVWAGREVVVYDARDSTSAARLWWLLRHCGHEAVRVLDGGLQAWVAAGLPVEAGPAVLHPGVGGPAWVPRPGHMQVLGADEIPAFVEAGGLLLDARSAERFRGEAEPIDRFAGHIPGAVSAPTAANISPDGALLPPLQLRDRFAALGAAEPTSRVACYCGSGVTAAHEVLALEVAGIDAALYPGSWSEWISDPARPTEPPRAKA